MVWRVSTLRRGGTLLRWTDWLSFCVLLPDALVWVVLISLLQRGQTRGEDMAEKWGQVRQEKVHNVEGESPSRQNMNDNTKT